MNRRLPGARVRIIDRLLSFVGRASTSYRCAFEALEPRALLAVVAWDGGGDGTSWHDGNNWSTNVVPGVADDVTIDVLANPTIVYTSATGNRSVNSLVCRENVDMNTDDTFTVVTTVELDSTWLWRGGTIAGGAWDTTGGLFNVGNGGATTRTLNNSTFVGDIRITEGAATMLFIGGSFTAVRMLQVAGSGASLLFTNGTVVTGDILVESTVAVSTHSIQASGTATVTFAQSADVRVMPGTAGSLNVGVVGGALTLINDGTFSCENGSSQLRIGPNTVSLVNDGTLQATAGILTLDAVSWTNTDVIAASGTSTLNLGGSFETENLNLAGWNIASTATVNVTGALNNANEILQLTPTTGNWRLLGGSIVGGTVTYAGGAFLRVGSNVNNRLASVTVVGDVIMNDGNGVLRLGTGTRFAALRLTGTAASITVGCEPGYHLVDAILVETTGAGAEHHLQMTANGTLTIDPTGSVRVTAGTKRINLGSTGASFSGAMTLVNEGLISSEVSMFAQTVRVVAPSFTNEGIAQSTAGLLEFSSPTWSNAATGTITAAGGTVTLLNAWTNAGAVSATGAASIINLGGTFTTSTLNTSGFTGSGGATINITGTLTNDGTLALDSATGPWTFLGGTISGGTVTQAGTGVLKTSTNTGSTLSNVSVPGDLRMDVAGARLRILGATTFGSLRFAASNCIVGFSAGYHITGPIISETIGAVGAHSIGLTANGTLFIDATGSVVTPAGSTSSLIFGATTPYNGTVALVNDGLISQESSASGSAMTFHSTALTSIVSSGTIQVSAGTITVSAATTWSSTGALIATGGTLTLSGAWSNTGSISVSGAATVLNLGGTFTTASLNTPQFSNIGPATVNITGTLNNASATLTLTPAGSPGTGVFTMNGGMITGGSINATGGTYIRTTTNTASRLTDVAISGEVRLDIASARLQVQNSTTFSALRLMASNGVVGFTPGYVLQNPITAEVGASHALGLTSNGTLTVGATGSVTVTGTSSDLAWGASGVYNGVITLVNNGLMSAESTTGLIQFVGAVVPTFTNSSTGIMRTTVAGARIIVTATNWDNDGTIQATLGRVEFGGTYAANTSTGTIALTSGTVRFTSTVTNTASTLGFVNGSTGTVELQGSTFSGGNLNILSTLTTSVTSIATFAGGATINGDLAFPVFGGQMRVSGGLTLNGTATFTAAGVSLVFNGGTQALAGTANLVMVSGGGPDEISAAAGAVVTIAPGVVISGSGRFTSGSTFGGTGTFINQGTIRASAGTLSLFTSLTGFTNQGLMEALPGGVLELAHTTTTADIGDLRNNGGMVRLAGTITNTAATLPLNATTGSYTLQGGLIVGGSINAIDGAKLIVGIGNTNRLNGVTVNGDLDFATNPFPVLHVLSGLSLNGSAVMTAAGGTITFNGGSQLLGGSANIVMVFGGGPDSITADAGAVVTIGPNVVISGVGRFDGGIVFPGAGSFINQGTLHANAATGGLLELRTTVASFNNQGVMRASGGGLLLCSGGAASLANLSSGVLSGGAYEVIGASTLTTPAAAGNITTLAAGTTVLLDGVGSTWTALGQLASNAGDFELANGRAFNFAPAGNAFANSGTLTKSGTGTTTIGAPIAFTNTATGEVDVSGGTLAISGANGSNAGDLSIPVGGTLQFAAGFAHQTGSFMAGDGTVSLGAVTHTINGLVTWSVPSMAIGTGTTVTGAGSLTLTAASIGTSSITPGELNVVGPIAMVGGSTISLNIDTQSYGGMVTAAASTPVVMDGELIFLVGGFTGSDTPLTLNSFGVIGLSGTLTGISSLTTSGGGGVFVSAASIVTSGAQLYSNPVVINTATAALTSSTALVSFDSTLSTGVNSLTITGDEIDFADTVSGTGTLTLLPASTTQNIEVGPGDEDPLSLEITEDELNRFSDTFSGIVIGLLDGAATLFVGNYIFDDTVDLRMPDGGVVVTGTIRGTSNSSIIIRGSGATTRLRGDIITEGGSIQIFDSVIVEDVGTRLLDTTNNGTMAGGAIFIEGLVKSESLLNRSLTLTAGVASASILGSIGSGAGNQLGALSVSALGGVLLSGGSITTSGTQAYSGPVTLGAGLTVTSIGAAVAFNGSVNGAQTLTIGSGTGNVTFNGAVGATVALNSIVLNSGGTRTFAGPVSVSNLSILGAATVLNAAATVATSQLSGGSLGGTGAMTVTTSLAWSGGSMIGSGKTIIAQGATLSISGAGLSLQRELENNGTAAWTTGDLSFTAGTFTNKLGGILNANSTGAFTGTGTLNNMGTVQRSVTGTGTVSGLALTNTGLLSVSQGILALTPAAGTFTNAGGISVAAGTVLQVNGNLVQGSTSSIAINVVSSDPQTGGGRVLASGSMTLGGSLTITIANGYDLGGGNWCVRAGSLSGRFSSVSLPPSVDGISPRISYSSTGVRLKFTGTPFVPAV